MGNDYKQEEIKTGMLEGTKLHKIIETRARLDLHDSGWYMSCMTQHKPATQRRNACLIVCCTHNV